MVLFGTQGEWRDDFPNLWHIGCAAQTDFYLPSPSPSIFPTLPDYVFDFSNPGDPEFFVNDPPAPRYRDVVEGFIDYVANVLPSYKEDVSADYGRDWEPEVISLIFRWSRDNVHEYSNQIAALKALGVRVVTVDFNATTSQAAATGTASEPHERNLFTFPTHWDINEPAVTQSLRNDVGRDCVVSGRTQVQTFDGVTFRHDGIGDYTLFRQYPGFSMIPMAQGIEVQVRKTQCEDTTKRAACISGVGLRASWIDVGSITAPMSTLENPPPIPVSVDMTFQYDRTHNDVAFTFLGSLIPSEAINDLFGRNITIVRIEPDVGIHIEVSLPIFSDFFLSLPPEAADILNQKVLTIEFFTDPSRDAVVVVHGTVNAWVMGYGICGTYDSCALNDLVQTDGTLGDDNVTTTATWRVHGGASLFEWTQFVEDPYADDPAAYTLRQPLIEKNWVSQVNTGRGGLTVDSTPLSPEAEYLMCYEACEHGESASAWINTVGRAAACSGLCDEEMVDLDGLSGFDVHGDYNETKVPVVSVSEQNGGQKASFRAPIGGKYVFHVSSHDCCYDTPAANVTVNVKCQRSFTAHAGKDVLLEYGPFPMPVVRLVGKVEGAEPSEYHVSWKVIEWPHMPKEEDNTTDPYEVDAPPPIMYRHSLMPSFQPADVGNYTLEFVAFDGCHRSVDTVIVGVACVDRPYAMTAEAGTAVLWLDGLFKNVNVSFDEICQQAPRVSHPNLTTELSFITAKSPLFQIERDPASAPSGGDAWLIFYERNSTMVETNITHGTAADLRTESAWVPLPRTLAVIRVEGEYRIIEEKNDRSYDRNETVTYVGHLRVNECRVTADKNLAAGHVDQTWSFVPLSDRTTPEELPMFANGSDVRAAAGLAAPFDFGICEGMYGVAETISDRTACSDAKENFQLEATCGADWTGPLSLPIGPCFENKFFYEGSTFNQSRFTFDSSDRWDRSLDFVRRLVSWPNGTAEPTWGFDIPQNEIWMDGAVEGDYVFEEYSSNRCNVDGESAVVSLTCAGDVHPNMTCPPSAVSYDYTGMMVNVIVHPYSDARYRNGLPVPATWDFFGVRADGTEILLPFPVPPGTTFLPIPIGFALSFLGGDLSFGFGVRATDDCRTAQQVCHFDVTCQNTLTVRARVINTTLTVFSDGAGNWLGDTVTVEDTSTSGAYPITSGFWDFYSNRGSHITAPIRNGTWPLNSGPADWNATLTIVDGCLTAQSTPILFRTICTPISLIHPYIQVVTGDTILFWENHTIVTVTGAASSIDQWRGFTLPLSGRWFLTGPDGVETFIGSFTPPFTTTATFDPDETGEWKLRLELTDDCNVVNTTMSFFVNCLSLVTPVARASPSTTVTWNGLKFPIVTLDGSLSAVARDTPSYEWQVLHAPKGSVFLGRKDGEEEPLDETEVIEDSLVTSWDSGNGWTVDKYNRTVVYWAGTHKLYRETRLLPLGPEAAQPYGVCFRPDVPGLYEIELRLTTGCHEEVTTINVNAQCNSAPAVALTIPATTFVWDRIQFQATATDVDNDELSYDWTIVNCANESVDYTNDLLGNGVPNPMFVPWESGVYCITLDVSDGCTVVTSKWSLNVTCNETMPAIENQEITTPEFNGIGLQQIEMEIPIGEFNDAKWLDGHSYTWTVVGFQGVPAPRPARVTGGGIAGIVIGALALAAIVAALTAFFIRRLLKKQKSEGSELAMPPKPTGVEMTPAGTGI